MSDNGHHQYMLAGIINTLQTTNVVPGGETMVPKTVTGTRSRLAAPRLADAENVAPEKAPVRTTLRVSTASR